MVICVAWGKSIDPSLKKPSNKRRNFNELERQKKLGGKVSESERSSLTVAGSRGNRLVEKEEGGIDLEGSN